MKKKLISVLASIMILSAGSTSMALTVSADTGVAFEVAQISTAGTITDGKLAEEEIVMVPVTITENKGITAFLLEFTQDSNIEILAAKNKNSDYTENGTFTWNVNALCLLWSENSCLDSTKCGTVVELQVKVPAGTPVGTYEIGFNESEIQVTNTTFDSIEYTLTSGYVQVGGNTADNPVAETQAPVVTEAPAVVTQAPAKATQAPVNTTTQAQARATAPASTEAPAVTTADVKTTSNASAQTNVVTDTSSGNAVSGTSLENAVSGTSSGNAVSGGTESDSVSTANVNSVQASETTSASTQKNSSASSNSSKSSSSVNKTSDSPSTGASGVVVPIILLAVSTTGVIIASKKKNK